MEQIEQVYENHQAHSDYFHNVSKKLAKQYRQVYKDIVVFKIGSTEEEAEFILELWDKGVSVENAANWFHEEFGKNYGVETQTIEPRTILPKKEVASKETYIDKYAYILSIVDKLEGVNDDANAIYLNNSSEYVVVHSSIAANSPDKYTFVIDRYGLRELRKLKTKKIRMRDLIIKYFIDCGFIRE